MRRTIDVWPGLELVEPELDAEAAEEEARAERRYLRAKRALDIGVCLLLLPVALPVIAVCAVLIKLDSPGPVFFIQPRAGLGGKPFNMVKLRTMVTGAQRLKAVVADKNLLKYPDFKVADDPRVTRVGRFLRRTSLDELPQMFNVLKGDMSLVGPRPTSFGADTYSLWQTERLEVRPGVTGLWQVSGRNLVEFDERSRMDIVYAQNRSLLFDVKILLRTFGAVVRGHGVV